MTRKARNILSATVAAFGVASLIYLEAVATVGAVDVWTASALITGFAAAGVMRWYLFYEGQTLREINEAAARIAFRWSVGLSVFVIIYAVTLYATGDIDWRTLTVFLLVVSTLSVVEWVFGQRAGANVNPLVIRLTSRVRSLAATAWMYRRLSREQGRKIEALTKDLRSLKSEHDSTAFQVVQLRDDLSKFVRNAGRFVRVSSTNLATVCPACGTIQVFNQSAHVRKCNDCALDLTEYLTAAK